MRLLKKMAAVFAAAAVASVSVATMSVHTSAAGEVAQAYFIGGFGAEKQNWSPGENSGVTTASITGDGQYTVEWNLTCEGAATETGDSWFLAVCISPTVTDPTTGKLVNFTTDTYPDLKVTLDEISVNGTPVAEYSAGAKAINTAYYEKDPGVTRITFHDSWTGADIKDLPDMTIENNIKAVFTVSGIPADAAGGNGNGGSNDVTGSSNNDVSSNDTTTGNSENSSNNSSSGNDSSNNSSNSSSSSSSSGNNNTNSNSNKSNSASNNGASTNNNATTSQTGDFGIAAIVLGAVATAALGVGAFTVTRRKK